MLEMYRAFTASSTDADRPTRKHKRAWRRIGPRGYQRVRDRHWAAQMHEMLLLFAVCPPLALVAAALAAASHVLVLTARLTVLTVTASLALASYPVVHVGIPLAQALWCPFTTFALVESRLGSTPVERISRFMLTSCC